MLEQTQGGATWGEDEGDELPPGLQALLDVPLRLYDELMKPAAAPAHTRAWILEASLRLGRAAWLSRRALLAEEPDLPDAALRVAYLTRAADQRLLRLAPQPSTLAALSRPAWRAHANALAVLRGDRAGRAASAPEHRARSWAPLGLAWAAAAWAAHRPELVPSLLGWFEAAVLLCEPEDGDVVARRGALTAELRSAGFPMTASALRQVTAAAVAIDGLAPRTGRAPATHTPAEAKRAALAFLCADPTHREAWEVHRWGFMGLPTLTGRVFATGVVLENLTVTGRDCGAEIARLQADYEAQRFHSFEEPSGQPPDIATLGLFLRLQPFSATRDEDARRLAHPLRWVAANVSANGEIPTFMREGIDLGRPYLEHMVGDRCVAARAGLLLGLLAHPQRSQDVLQRVAAATLDHFLDEGAAAIALYDELYAGWMILELTHTLELHGPALADRCAAAAGLARALLAARAERGDLSPLDAAFLLLAAPRSGASAADRTRWIARLLETQGPDGSWAACPAYLAAAPGNLLCWFSSRTLTTSFCYRALACAREM